ncbi:MAG: hypothetical protein WAL32_01190 [Terriglobales bacterium]
MNSLAQPETPEAWRWPDSLDALRAAPAHHQLLLENDRVRVIHTRIPAGDLVPVHTHRWPGIAYLLSWSDFVRRDQHGKVLMDSREAGDPPQIPAVQWLNSLPPHSVENVGQSEISILLIELKDVARSE